MGVLYGYKVKYRLTMGLQAVLATKAGRPKRNPTNEPAEVHKKKTLEF